MTYATFTDISGQSIRWNPADTAAIIPHPEELANPVARTRLVSGTGAMTVVLGTALATATALALQTVGATFPVSQVMAGPTTLSGANAYLIPGSSPVVSGFAIPGDATVYTRVTWKDGQSVIVVGAPATVAAAIDGSVSGPGGRLVLQAYVNGATGAILGTISDYGVTLAATTPYVAGSGFWAWTLGGSNVPASFIVQPNVLSGQVSNMGGAQLGGAGSPNFFTLAVAIDRVLASGSSNAAGAAFQNWGASVARAAAGLYDITLDAAPDGDVFTLFATVAGGAGADRAVDISYTSATVARIRFSTQAGVNTDTPFSFVAFGAQAAGNSGYQPTEPIYTLQVFSADA